MDMAVEDGVFDAEELNDEDEVSPLASSCCLCRMSYPDRVDADSTRCRQYSCDIASPAQQESKAEEQTSSSDAELVRLANLPSSVRLLTIVLALPNLQNL